ncbi:hypothetical protein RHGRI_027670 [Rhododendron griersonianum]|uniref:Pentatricopeptide repeat-containing protein n=1 Tax=Rhododendron griersonianum TaxID=479676 RepID=A0AAV6IYE7_9ERIC|nr:hypothetical protein RHGRI_027670 [Rhododendron griersonianum]
MIIYIRWQGGNPISSVLSVCAEYSALGVGREIHGHTIKAIMDGNILVGNGLINMYTKCGSLDKALLVFEEIDGRDLVSRNLMIAGYGMHGLGNYALETFEQMMKAGYNPDGVSFVAVLSACSHAGLVSEGRKIFKQMESKFGIEPQVEHYSYIAQETASRIFSLDSETIGSYTLLSNIYASTGRWDDSARVRISAKAKGLKKIPGQSWIEVQNKCACTKVLDVMVLGSIMYSAYKWMSVVVLCWLQFMSSLEGLRAVTLTEGYLLAVRCIPV